MNINFILITVKILNAWWYIWFIQLTAELYKLRRSQVPFLVCIVSVVIGAAIGFSIYANSAMLSASEWQSQTIPRFEVEGSIELRLPQVEWPVKIGMTQDR